MTLFRKSLLAIAAAGLAMALCLPQAKAADATYNLGNVFSGNQSDLTGSVLVELTNLNSTTVQLQVTALFSGNASEFLGKDGLYLNFDPAKSLPGTFTYVSGQAFSSIDTGTDNFKADGDGKYDINLGYAASGADRFTDGETSVYNISNAQAADFAFLSAPAGGNGPFTTAAHIQGTANGSSVWVTSDPVPEPIFYQMSALLGLGGVGLLRLRKARKDA